MTAAIWTVAEHPAESTTEATWEAHEFVSWPPEMTPEENAELLRMRTINSRRAAAGTTAMLGNLVTDSNRGETELTGYELYLANNAAGKLTPLSEREKIELEQRRKSKAQYPPLTREGAAQLLARAQRKPIK